MYNKTVIESLKELSTNVFRMYCGDFDECLKEYTRKYGECNKVYEYTSKSLKMKFIYIG